MVKRKLKRTRPTPRRIMAIVGGTIVLLGFGTGVVFASTTTTTNYRTAIAQLGTVNETLAVNGTIASATRRDLAFEVGGTVDSIAVDVGDEVAAGDTLAELDTDDLQAAVDAAETLVAQARQTLSTDLDSQTSSSSSSSSSSDSSGSGGSGAGGGGSSGPTPAETAAIAAVTAAQQNLLALVDAADAALATSQTAEVASSADCAPFLAATLPAAGDPNDPAYDAAAEAAALAAALADAQAKLTTCQSSTAATGDAQAATSTAQNAVTAGMTALDDAITQLQAALGAPSSGGSSGGSGSTPAASTPTVSGTGMVASAADIVADKAAITSAEAQVDLAEQQLDAATLTTPIGGTVAQIGFSDGDSVAAGATDTVISVIGDDGYLIESTVSLAQVPKVKVGQDATVTIASSGDTYTGSVSAVGITNVSETSTPAYEITLSVDAGGQTLLNGAAATADIAVASADSVLTVPISALHSDDSGDTVDVLADGKVTPTPVEVGAVGADAVEITSGLSAGDVVVLADLDEQIATSDSTTNTGLTGLTDGGSGGEFPAPPDGFVPPDGFTPPQFTQSN